MARSHLLVFLKMVFYELSLIPTPNTHTLGSDSQNRKWLKNEAIHLFSCPSTPYLLLQICAAR